jgi:hypothetical protein
MDLHEQARVTRDQLQINRVQQAVVTVALEKGGLRGRRVLADPEPAARRAIRILAASGGDWLSLDGALLDGLRGLWTRIA